MPRCEGQGRSEEAREEARFLESMRLKLRKLCVSDIVYIYIYRVRRLEEKRAKMRDKGMVGTYARREKEGLRGDDELILGI